jgi:hypothetical protein
VLPLAGLPRLPGCSSQGDEGEATADTVLPVLCYLPSRWASASWAFLATLVVGVGPRQGSVLLRGGCVGAHQELSPFGFQSLDLTPGRVSLAEVLVQGSGLRPRWPSSGPAAYLRSSRATTVSSKARLRERLRHRPWTCPASPSQESLRREGRHQHNGPIPAPGPETLLTALSAGGSAAGRRPPFPSPCRAPRWAGEAVDRLRGSASSRRRSG